MTVSLDVMINYKLDGIPYLCLCNFTVCTCSLLLPEHYTVFVRGENVFYRYVKSAKFDRKALSCQKICILEILELTENHLCAMRCITAMNFYLILTVEYVHTYMSF